MQPVAPRFFLIFGNVMQVLIIVTVVVNLLISYPLIMASPLRQIEAGIMKLLTKFVRPAFILSQLKDIREKKVGPKIVQEKKSKNSHDSDNTNISSNGTNIRSNNSRNDIHSSIKTDPADNREYDEADYIEVTPPLTVTIPARIIGIALTYGIVMIFKCKVASMGLMVDLLGSLFCTTLCVNFPFLAYYYQRKKALETVKENPTLNGAIKKISDDDDDANVGLDSNGNPILHKKATGKLYNTEFFLYLFCFICTFIIAGVGVATSIPKVIANFQ